MRIVVTGGTGFIGREVVRRLLETGTDEVVVTSRDPRRHHGRGVEMVQAFAGDLTSLARAFAHAEVVVHAIQFPNHPVEKPGKGFTYLEVDGRGTEVAALAAKRAGVRRVVYLSGAGAGENRPQPWFRAKDRAETAIRQAGLEYVFLRPSWIYGRRDRSMNRFVNFCRYLPVVPVIGTGRTPVYPIAVQDVARVAAESARRTELKDAAFGLAGPERLTMDEVVGTIQKVLGTHRPILHQPAALMKLLVLPMQLLPEPILSPGAIDFVTGEVEMDPLPAQSAFGSFLTLEEGLRTYLP
jgi:NADH dehydrogenase